MYKKFWSHLTFKYFFFLYQDNILFYDYNYYYYLFIIIIGNDFIIFVTSGAWGSDSIHILIYRFNHSVYKGILKKVMIIPFSVVFLLYYIFVVVITKIVTKSLHCTYFVKQISYAIRFLSYEIKKVDFPFPPRFSFQEFSSFHRFSLFCIFSPFLSVFTFRCFIFLPLKLSEATSTKM